MAARFVFVLAFFVALVVALVFAFAFNPELVREFVRALRPATFLLAAFLVAAFLVAAFLVAAFLLAAFFVTVFLVVALLVAAFLAAVFFRFAPALLAVRTLFRPARGLARLAAGFALTRLLAFLPDFVVLPFLLVFRLAALTISASATEERKDHDVSGPCLVVHRIAHRRLTRIEA